METVMDNDGKMRFVLESNHGCGSATNGASITPDSIRDGHHHQASDSPSSTPSTDIFDPFNAAPDKLSQAPYSRKYDGESRLSVARQLTFVPCSSSSSKEPDIIDISDEEEEERILFEHVYLSILEAIISTHKHGDLLLDGFTTPTSAPHLNGIADTCPRAPLKSTDKFRRFDKEICRKLEF